MIFSSSAFDQSTHEQDDVEHDSDPKKGKVFGVFTEVFWTQKRVFFFHAFLVHRRQQQISNALDLGMKTE